MLINAGQLVDALSASLFALVGIWAAVVHRHWFLRFAVVGGSLALALLIPAYEPVIEFGLQTAIIALGVTLWRGRAAWKPRVSVETALLAMVVVAVVAAVAGAAPNRPWVDWFSFLNIGFKLGAFSLLCLWIVCGNTGLRYRVPLGVLGCAALLALFHFGAAVHGALARGGQRGSLWDDVTASYRAEFVLGWLKWFAPTVAMSAAVLLTVLSLGHASGWFSSASASKPPVGRARAAQRAARVALCLAFGTVLAPNLYLLYKLCTPPARLPENVPADNGYDDFVAAGSIPGVDYKAVTPADVPALSDADLSRLAVEYQQVYDRINLGLGKPSWCTRAYDRRVAAEHDYDAVIQAVVTLEIPIEQARRRADWADFIELLTRAIQLGHNAARGSRLEFSMDDDIEVWNVERLRSSLGDYSATECRMLIDRMLTLEQLREPYEMKLKRQHAFDHGRSWQAQLHFLVAQWNGKRKDSDYDARQAGLARAGAAVLIADAAIQAYWLEHRAIPESLGDLVPDYLPATPLDPISGRPLLYSQRGGVYSVYSFGCNGQDDGGVSLAGNWSNIDDADVVGIGPHWPSPPPWVRAAVASAITRGWEWAKAAAAEGTPPTAPR